MAEESYQIETKKLKRGKPNFKSNVLASGYIKLK